jgi:hypothetical protein
MLRPPPRDEAHIIYPARPTAPAARRRRLWILTTQESSTNAHLGLKAEHSADKDAVE